MEQKLNDKNDYLFYVKKNYKILLTSTSNTKNYSIQFN